MYSTTNPKPKKTKAIKVIVFLMSLIVFMTSCGTIKKTFEEGDKFSTDYLVYCYINEIGTNRRSKYGAYICILEFTLLGQKQERIIIPDEINGKPVVQIGMVGLGWSTGIKYRDSVIKKFYLPKYFVNNQTSYRFFNAKTFLIDTNEYENFPLNGIIYVSNNLYNKININNIDESITIFKIANISYISNDEVYFIDDCEDGEVLLPPPVPSIEGKIFVGWFKEEECINEWDFEKEKFQLDEDIVTMQLYAKWI